MGGLLERLVSEQQPAPVLITRAGDYPVDAVEKFSRALRGNNFDTMEYIYRNDRTVTSQMREKMDDLLARRGRETIGGHGKSKRLNIVEIVLTGLDRVGFVKGSWRMRLVQRGWNDAQSEYIKLRRSPRPGHNRPAELLANIMRGGRR
ncbi:hypothetical protein A2721_01755 [Candidatus Gottesmanbacteria bacterium RIFCSPHIGHO2_01_FULL_47_48]|uniref:Uncharacterized protein n=1 Tax=Candidatus Gottesmanbacteria bacterium RIFCSPHIGHO2_01_FULL_47_48 TaxID=1798381 RepID=A0A1F6A1E4_9BACT|nr:MAG: hypothetical protein A2721_01755 [Candidatus Gottesmanbacteria bacterium RIFCSPHIGHO2_01_FULL_47_48]